MLKEKEPWVFPFSVGSSITFRHCDLFCDEPHQLPAIVETVNPYGRGFNVSIKTDDGERFLVKGVNKKNFSLVFEP